MTRKQGTETEYQTNSCSNCGAAVKARRPSRTGLHYCAARECRNAKQRAYRALSERAADLRLEHQQQVFLAALIREALSGEGWRTCGRCGAERVLVGWSHRQLGAPRSACYGIGSSGKELAGLGHCVFDAVMPHLSEESQRANGLIVDESAPPAPSPAEYEPPKFQFDPPAAESRPGFVYDPPAMPTPPPTPPVQGTPPF